jgi:hypothetical protein
MSEISKTANAARLARKFYSPHAGLGIRNDAAYGQMINSNKESGITKKIYPTAVKFWTMSPNPI